MLLALLAIIALLALAAPVLVIAFPPRIVPLRHIVPVPARVVPQAEIPTVEPVAFQALDPDPCRHGRAHYRCRGNAEEDLAEPEGVCG